MWVSVQWKLCRREKHLVSCGKSLYWMIISVLFSNIGCVSLHSVCAAIWESKNAAFFLPGQHHWYAGADSSAADCAQDNVTKHIKHLPFSLTGLKQPGSTVDKAYCKYVPEMRAGISTAGSEQSIGSPWPYYLLLLLFCSNTSWTFTLFTLKKLCSGSCAFVSGLHWRKLEHS